MTLKTHPASLEEMLIKAVKKQSNRFRGIYRDGVLVLVADTKCNVFWMRLPKGDWGWYA